MSVPTTTDVRIADDVGDGGTLSARARAAALLVGVSVTAAIGLVADELLLLAFAPTYAAAALAAAHDRATGRLPNRLVAATAAFGTVAALAIGGPDAGIAWLTGALALSLPLLALHLVSPCAMGFGDVKFAAALGGLVGLLGADIGERIADAMVVLTIVSALAVVGSIAMRRPSIALGPWLFVGAVGFVLVGARDGWSL